MMGWAHQLILAAGVLGLLSILAGLLSLRVGAPLLLVFLGVGMIAGEALPGAVEQEDFRAAYLVGSVALAVILFDGGLRTPPRLVRLAWGPALVLATLGVALTAGAVGVAVKLITGAPWLGALLAGAAVAPTDAAAVGALLRRAQVGLPERVDATLELESGLNDPASVFLTLLLMLLIREPGSIDAGGAVLLFLQQMGGGAVLGGAGGFALVALLRRLPLEESLAMVLALAGMLTVFGLAQVLETSGFLAVYVAALIVGPAAFPARQALGPFVAGLAWLSQIVLFVMLGLLVTPAQLLPLAVPAVLATAALIVVARPLAVLVCLAPFGFAWREIAFIAWVGLRGAVPIYLSIVPVIGDPRGIRLFDSVFVAVVASLVVQGWTIGVAARLLGFGPAPGSGDGGAR